MELREGGKDGCRKSPQEPLLVARPQAPFPRAASAAACSDPLVQRVVAFTALIPGLRGVFTFFFFVFTAYSKRTSKKPKDGSL